MKRILFVDDEPEVLAGLRNALYDRRRQWDMLFLTTGQDALAALELEPFDLVVSDIRMNDMDGITLLNEVRRRHATTARLVLSGVTDRESVLRALPVAQQFLSKPCDSATLHAALDRVFSLQELIGDPAVHSLVGGLESLPSLPSTYGELMRAVEEPNTSLDDLAMIVESDAGLAGRVLQLANSSFFTASRRTLSVRTAVSYLGVEILRAITLVTHVFKDLEHIRPTLHSLARLKDHSLQVARLARRMATEPKRAELAFTAGLLHDVGMVILAQRSLARFSRIDRIAAETGRAFHEAERELGPPSHAEVGAFLLGTWGLPFDLVEVVAFHHTPGRVHEGGSLDVLAAVHVADSFVHATDSGASDPNATLDSEFLERSGHRAKLDAWWNIAIEEAASEPNARGA
ncbi:MAG: HDOD domain-containing protein [Candidatus Eisenbacteria bacterium]|uniref:HDOD domain-containing protein n=1 Tax=Eiseniibacteriota bacterium TaxID=2212470 RepID=A0A849T214_UNCEI|nr:HDOD domain-containing protein [Candidatus Eisenbacteria bacterium]